jgi:hypothetical protein
VLSMPGGNVNVVDLLSKRMSNYLRLHDSLCEMLNNVEGGTHKYFTVIAKEIN